MTYQILNEKNKVIKVVKANYTKEELLRNYPIGYTTKEVK